MRPNSARPSTPCAVPWTKIDPRATSSIHEPDRSAGRGSAWNDHESELLRAGKDKGLGRLNALKGMVGYAPITTPVMLKAAEFWATARKSGRQSASDAALDADMILVAQAVALVRDDQEAVIATTNVRHLALFASAPLARDWLASVRADGPEARRRSGRLVRVSLPLATAPAGPSRSARHGRWRRRSLRAGTPRAGREPCRRIAAADGNPGGRRQS